MMRKPALPSDTYNRRIRLSSREILLALAVTLAAVVFAAAARHVATPSETAPAHGERGSGEASRLR